MTLPPDWFGWLALAQGLWARGRSLSVDGDRRGVGRGCERRRRGADHRRIGGSGHGRVGFRHRRFGLGRYRWFDRWWGRWSFSFWRRRIGGGGFVVTCLVRVSRKFEGERGRVDFDAHVAPLDGAQDGDERHGQAALLGDVEFEGFGDALIERRAHRRFLTIGNENDSDPVRIRHHTGQRAPGRARAATVYRTANPAQTGPRRR